MGEVGEAEAEVLVQANFGALSKATFKGARQSRFKVELQGGEEGVQGPMRDS